MTYLPISMKIGGPAPQIGRPRSFNPEIALEKALKVFWRRGYAGASLSELTAAMGITRPSLYAAFGNKEELFHKALDLYMGGLANGSSEPRAPCLNICLIAWLLFCLILATPPGASWSKEASPLPRLMIRFAIK
jgi:AcrR family transcriptional regulator